MKKEPRERIPLYARSETKAERVLTLSARVAWLRTRELDIHKCMRNARACRGAAQQRVSPRALILINPLPHILFIPPQGTVAVAALPCFSDLTIKNE